MARKRSRLLRNARHELARALDAHVDAVREREDAGAGGNLDAAIDRLRIRRVRVVRVAEQLVDLVLTDADRRELGGRWAQAELFDDDTDAGDDADLGELPPEPEDDLSVFGARSSAFFEGKRARAKGAELDSDAGDDWRKGWEEADEMIRTGVVVPGPAPGTNVPDEVLDEDVADADAELGDGKPHAEDTYMGFVVGGRALANNKPTTIRAFEITRYAKSDKVHRARVNVLDDDGVERTIPAAWLKELDEAGDLEKLAEAPTSTRSGKLPRGTCGTCGRDVALRRNGTTREHNDNDGRTCSGSADPPAPAPGSGTDVPSEDLVDVDQVDETQREILRARRYNELESLKSKALDKVAAELEFRDARGFLVGTGLSGADELALHDLIDAIVDVERGAWSPLPAWASGAGPGGQRRIAIPVEGHEGLPNTIDHVFCGSCGEGRPFAVVNLGLSPNCPGCGAAGAGGGWEFHSKELEYERLDNVVVGLHGRDGAEIDRFDALVMNLEPSKVAVQHRFPGGPLVKTMFSRKTGIAIGEGGRHSPTRRKIHGRSRKPGPRAGSPFVLPVRLQDHTEDLDYYKGDVAEVVHEDAEGVELERFRVDVGDVNGRWIWTSWKRPGERALSVAKFHRYSGIMNNDELVPETGRRRIVARVTS